MSDIVLDGVAGTRAAPRHGAWEAVRAAFYLGAREVRVSLRTPAYLIPNLLMPVLFFFFLVGSLSEFAARFGVDNWRSFLLPMSVLFAVTGGSAGLNMVTDIESGYFDKLLLTPANRLAILFGAMAADFLRIILQGLFIVVVALATGTVFATGIVGAVVMVGIASLWGLAYSAIGFALALKTGNSQVVGSMWALQIPFIFLTTSFAPMEALSGWLRTAATYNPVTYLLRALRSLSMHGWDAGEIAIGLATVAGLGLITLTIALRALLGRIR